MLKLQIRRALTLALVFVFILQPDEGRVAVAQGRTATERAGVAYNLSLPNGKYAEVYTNGFARVYPSATDRSRVEMRVLPRSAHLGDAPNGIPDPGKTRAFLAKEPRQPYAAGWVVVVYRTGVTALRDSVVLDEHATIALRSAAAQHAISIVPQYTNDVRTNVALAHLGVDDSERLFKGFSRSTLSAMHAGVRMTTGQRLLDFSSAYKVHVTSASVQHAVQALTKLPTVEYASPDWIAEPMHSDSIRLNETPQALTPAQSSPSVLPSNYAITSSLQSLLNAPSDDVAAAYDEIQRHFHELPGQGEIITNVSLGDLDDASAVSNANNPCNPYASGFGPTTELLGGQRYINLPSMPLIPTYTADAGGNLNGSGEVCGVDPFLSEVDLDFSMMAPLPHNLQRASELGHGPTDLLGIAPGAQYRLIVPSDPASTTTDIDAALLGAATQNPRPNVITASLGFGLDAYGFPSRFLEDDPMTEAIIASIVQDYHIVVCVAANDGTREFTFVAIGPSGGSAPTSALSSGGTPTNLNDIAFSTAPSLDFDSGSIDAGGTTLDDIFSDPPQDGVGPNQRAQHAYAETRWTGFTNFSSGFGSRVNVSAPADNIVAFEHHYQGADDAVDVVLDGGTSASSPEIAAAAAVVEQVARLTGHPFTDPQKLRTFLEQTASPVLPVSQSDVDLHVGPQVDVRRAVESVLAQGGIHDNPSVARVAVEQRRNFANADGVFVSDTDPANIDLGDSYCSPTCFYQALNEHAWITIAPDWEFVSAGAKYSLEIAGSTRVLATTPWARLQPEAILNAAGLPLVSSTKRTVKLTYTASGAGRKVSTTFSLTFGSAPEKSDEVLAPLVPSVVHGPTIPVTYDITHAAHVASPLLMVSEPGRIDDWTGTIYHPAFTMPLTALKGTVQVPVSALQGGGIYGFGIFLDAGSVAQNGEFDSDFAFARIAPAQANDARPLAPLLSSNGSAPGHFLEIPYNGTFQITYDVSNVLGATGAELEISGAGPTIWGIYNPFNNPNGSERDDNRVDAGSVYFAPLAGTSGTVSLNGKSIGLDPAMDHVVRVIPMKFGVPAGEGSDVSTITMDGILPADGGAVAFGFGVNGNGYDGFLTSGQLTASGQVLSSLETFDQNDGAITRTISSVSDPEDDIFITVPTTTGGWGIYGSDVGLFGKLALLKDALSEHLLNPVADGMVGAAWSPPASLQSLLWAAAWNQANDTAVFLAQDSNAPSKDPWRVFASNLKDNTFSPSYDVSMPVQKYRAPTFLGFAEDTSLNEAIGLGYDAANQCAAPTIVTTDLAKGTVDSFAGISNAPRGITVDSKTGRAASPANTSACFTNGVPMLAIYNLSSKSGFHVPIPHDAFANVQDATLPVTDEIHHLFLVVQPLGADVDQNNNALGHVLIYNENGDLEKTIAQFNLLGVFLQVNGQLQLNSQNRTGYTFGPGTSQLVPFNY